MRKKILVICSVLLLAMILVACSGEDSAINENANSVGENNDTTEEKASSEEVIEMDINNYLPSTHHYAFNVFEPWKEMVEEKTDGRVRVNLYHGASLGKGTSVYQDVSGGLYDVSFITANYFYDTAWFPYTIGNLPFAIEGPEAASKILLEFGEKYANDELSKELLVMTPTSTDGYDLFSNTPIRTIDDLEGLKMRVNGKSENAFVQSLGGVPVSLGTDETYEGLDKGMIDTTFYTPIGAVGTKFYEPAPYLTKLAVSVTPTIPVMGKHFYDSLPEDLQTLFVEELNPELSRLLQESYLTLLEESQAELKDLVVEAGGEYIELSDSDLEEFRTISKAAWDTWKEDADSKGYNGQEMVDDFFKMLEDAGYPAPY